MIPILFDSDETMFTSNGICRLSDCITCSVTEERNGVYECDFEYPVNGAHYDQITLGRIIACTHEDSDNLQPFDIVSFTREINGVTSYHAVHVSYRQTQMVVHGTNISSLSGALTLLGTASPSNPFAYNTDMTSTNKLGAADGVPRTVRQMLGGVEGSILDSYGGEYEWDKWDVNLWKARGEEKGFVIRYGVNLVDYKEELDYSDTYSAVIPYWTKDDPAGRVTVVGSRVDSGLAMYVDRNICVPLDLTDKFQSEPTAAELQTYAASYMEDKEVNIPKQNIHVDFAHLEDADIYSELMKCKICDQIRVILPFYEQEQTYFKIVKTEYNVLKDRYESMELGDLSTTLSKALGLK